MKNKLWLPAIVLAFMTGCATSHKTLYHWGEYETLLLDMYTNPGEVDNYTQITKINESIAYAESKGLKVAPGIYAHLGMIYAKNGDMPNAISAFENEKKYYPESATFIDGMLSRASAN
ncbi:DUF4810 domain-containing protein [Litoribrevibacter euphylliae]|uniref:DUF4810 domain-containing protein n=1 Tax=Litoribrevibacter euphylliae TaxID=1834034 RepID=A0ABV7HDU7_9GAMM